MNRLVLALTAILAACGGDEDDACTIDTTYDPAIDSARFVAEVTNPLFPLPVGASWTYEGGGETIEVTVTTERRTILGISATVVHDVASIDGEIIEDTLDFYAQDDDGNVWYFGGHDRVRERRVAAPKDREAVSTMPSRHPIPHDPWSAFRIARSPREAEDFGEVVALDQTVTVGGITHTGCLQTKDTTPLEADLQEHKFYCPDVGLVLIVDLVTDGREELVDVTGL
jgi:hypothetical protein